MSEVERHSQEFIRARNESIPKEPGFYWARLPDFKWCNFIVRIKGEAPYLEYEAWNLIEGALIKGKNPEELRVLFVKKIEEPTEEEVRFFNCV